MDPVIIGQVESQMTTDIGIEEDLRVLLRVNWTVKSPEITFNPEEELKRGDTIRITIEKISEAPVVEAN